MKKLIFCAVVVSLPLLAQAELFESMKETVPLRINEIVSSVATLISSESLESDTNNDTLTADSYQSKMAQASKETQELAPLIKKMTHEELAVTILLLSGHTLERCSINAIEEVHIFFNKWYYTLFKIKKEYERVDSIYIEKDKIKNVMDYFDQYDERLLGYERHTCSVYLPALELAFDQFVNNVKQAF